MDPSATFKKAAPDGGAMSPDPEDDAATEEAPDEDALQEGDDPVEATSEPADAPEDADSEAADETPDEPVADREADEPEADEPEVEETEAGDVRDDDAPGDDDADEADEAEPDEPSEEELQAVRDERLKQRFINDVTSAVVPAGFPLPLTKAQRFASGRTVVVDGVELSVTQVLHRIRGDSWRTGSDLRKALDQSWDDIKRDL